MVEARQETDRQLGDHVAAIRCIDFAIRSQREIVFTFAHGDARVISFLEVHNVCVLVVFVDREFRTRFDLTRVDEHAAIKRFRFPEEASAHRHGRKEQQSEGNGAS